MTTLAHRWIVPMLCLAIDGCIPARSTYFQPSASGGEMRQLRRECSDRANFVSFTKPGHDDIRVSLGAGADSDKGEARSLTLWLFIAKNGDDAGGLGFVFSSREERLRRMQEYARPVEVVASSDMAVISWVGGGQVAKLTLPPGNKIVVSDHFFQQPIAIEGFVGEWFDVALPSVAFEDTVLELPPIRFTRVDKVVVSAINC